MRVVPTPTQERSDVPSADNDVYRDCDCDCDFDASYTGGICDTCGRSKAEPPWWLPWHNTLREAIDVLRGGICRRACDGGPHETTPIRG